MPSTSAKQHKFMEAIAHSPEFAKKVGVPQSVGKDFATADKGKKFKEGGVMKSDMKEDMKMDKAQDKAMIKKAFKEHDAQEHKGGKGTKLALKKGGMPMKMAKGGMAKGGMKETMGPRTMAKDVEAGSNKHGKFGQSDVQKRGMTKGTNLGDSGPSVGMMGGMKKGGKIKKMASGGMTSSRADGVAQRGKTKVKYC
jgi:hypothetical protein